MVTRYDIEQDYNASPRVTTVQAPSTQMLAQDLVDTLRIEEETFRAVSEPHLLDAEGKADLGGGLFTGIVAAQQNNQVRFDRRDSPISTGSATSATTVFNKFISLIDNTATFISDGITRGAFVVNWQDRSTSEVYQVISETEIKCRELRNGTDNDFDLNDDYMIINIVQCDMRGGDVVAVDDMGAAISPVYPTAFTQVLIAASTSAALVEGTGGLTAAEIADAVWDEPAAEHETTGTMGKLLKDALTAARNAFSLTASK